MLPNSNFPHSPNVNTDKLTMENKPKKCATSPDSEKSPCNIIFLATHCEKNEGGTMSLVLRGNHLCYEIGKRITDRDIVKIVTFLRQHQEVVALDLAYNRITNCGMSTLADFMVERPVIRHLNLVGNDIGPRGIKYLANLGDRLTLYSLRLTGNKIGDEGGKYLSELLLKKTPLRYLDLSDTHQTFSGLAYVMAALVPRSRGSENLEYVDLGRPLPQEYHQLNDGHAAEFVAQILHRNKKLKEIHLQQYNFDFRDMELLLEGLLTNDTLICLDLNNNNIGDDGVDYLCKYLKTSPPLECLMIASNNIGDLGALSLSFNLPFSKIKLLDVSNNHMTDEGMINIFYTIKKKIKLRGMFMWGNKLTHTSLVVLKRLFQTDLLDPEHTDVSLFCKDDQLHAAWNYMANRYTHRFYCEYEYNPLSRLVYNRRPPMAKPHIYYKYHVDNADVGFPMCEWEGSAKLAKYFDPM